MQNSQSLNWFLERYKDSLSKTFTLSKTLANILTTSETDLNLAGEYIRQGKLVSFPTETVYGLGADALNESAIYSIFKTKSILNH